MGAGEGDTEADTWMEKPAHQVSLSTYKIAQTEVTQALWQAVMGNNPSHFTGSLQRPVESVSWIDAHEFIYRLNQLTGKKFRLATDAEWEFAARGGTKSHGYKYAGGNSVGTVAWYSGNSSNTTHDVATKQANELGIYDMSGNVAEWTQDMYYEYTDAAQINPNMGNSFLNVRNGGYSWDAKSCRLPYRTTYDGLIEEKVYDHVGLRIALDEDNSTKFRLSETVIEILEGEQRSVDILNGSGNYSVVNSELYSYFTGEASYYVNGNQLIVNGLSKGLSRVVVTNQSNGATAVLTVIVNELPKEQFTVGGVTFNMVSVEGGTFTMGNSSYTDAIPTHEVELSDFMMGQTEVTQALWKAVMGSNPSNFTGDLQRPVEQVSWNDCQKFILKLNQLTGRKFRLPTEAEWEFAARGGLRSRGYNYIGGNNLSDVAWFSSNAGNSTHEVAAKAFNESGFYDMGGNVNEWCQDWFGNYTSSLQMNPTGPASATSRVKRGGCYSDYQYSGNFNVAGRRSIAPTEADKTIGLRLALDPDNTTKFRMAEPVVTVEVGKNISVSFLNGNGSYSVAGSTTNFTRSIVSGKLKVTGTAVGTNTVTVTNTSTGATTVLTVIVTGAAQADSHEYVDLGLPSGTLWATCNVGANSPEDYGDYFAWGETEPKTTYSWATYKWCNGRDSTLTKYCDRSAVGTVDNKTELEVADDAAYVNWGSEWRMPSYTQIQELVDNCTSQWTTQNGVTGRKVTGPNGNSLFFPAAGWHYSGGIANIGSFGYYWSRTVCTGSTRWTYVISFYSDNFLCGGHFRCNGYNVRAVRVQ